MPNKKSQIEIMGLAIVVILVIIGMLFVVRFVVIRKPAEFKAEFTQTQLATNMLNAFLNSDTKSCSGMSITNLLQDCAQAQSFICDDGKGSCVYVRDAAKEIFSKTLEEWKLDYYFLVYFQGESPIIKLGNECAGDKKSKIFPVPTSTRSIYTKLDICS